MFKTAFVAVVAVVLVVPALICGCVRDVQTESAASFSLASGQTWDWVPEEETWQEYKRGAHQARINVNDAYAEQRQDNRAERQARRDEPMGDERKEERREENYDTEAAPPGTDPDAGDQARALKREHKHIQESIAGELSSKGIQPAEGASPTYYVAYYLFTNGEPVAPREYAAYQDRTDWGSGWDRFAEDALVIDIVDAASGQLLWSGVGDGNTRGGGDDSDRMRGVKEAVRHIMSDLK